MQPDTDLEEGEGRDPENQMDKLCFGDLGPLDAVVFELLD